MGEPTELAVQGFLDRAAGEGVFPGCVLAYGRPAEGRARFLWAGRLGLTRNRVPVCRDAVYDLASITKVASTAFLAMLAVDRGLLDLWAPVSGFGWRVPASHADLRVAHLLAHQSGFPAWRPFFLDGRLADHGRLAQAILDGPKVAGPGVETLYSDLNFILLGLVLEAVHGQDLGTLFAGRVAGPLGLGATGFRPRALSAPVAPTEDGPRLGGPLDWPGAKVMGPVPLGRVHDDNAAALGGVAGHAGLFGPAPEIWRIVADWARSLSGAPGGLASRAVVGSFLEPRPARRGPARALGFDLGQGPLEGARGHLGYTGGSVWWDPAGDRAFVLLCNRVHPTARGSRMEGFREGLATLLWS
ncbi:MAG: beta-lactamase family protein [Deltaproteobacteria bacterium]|nr:beta-lactamase family protein [Deltaproteobacteria bacterium]